MQLKGKLCKNVRKLTRRKNITFYINYFVPNNTSTIADTIFLNLHAEHSDVTVTRSHL
jgi:hypothetical protein